MHLPFPFGKDLRRTAAPARAAPFSLPYASAAWLLGHPLDLSSSAVAGVIVDWDDSLGSTLLQSAFEGKLALPFWLLIIGFALFFFQGAVYFHLMACVIFGAYWLP